MHITRTILTTLSIVLAIASSGQQLPKSVLFEHVTIPGSIRSSEVTDIVQDPEGVLWIAGDGLFRYDGVSFTRYTLLQDSSSIASSEINSLFYDKVKRRLLIATRNQGIVEYRYESNSLHKLPSKVGTPITNYFEQTQDGRVWVSSFNSGLLYLENDTVKAYTQKRFTGGSTTYLYTLGDRLLIADLTKVMVLRENEVTDSLMLSWPNTVFHAFGRVTAMAFDKRSKLYLGTEKQGVLVYDTLTKSFTKYFTPDKEPFYNRINRIFIDQEGLVWILTKSGGLAIYSPHEDRFTLLKRDPFSTNSLSGDNCKAILQDQTGIIWVGSTGDINKYDPNKVRFTLVTHNPNNKNSLSDKMVRGVFEDDQGNILAGTDGGYINRIHPETNTIERIRVTVPGYSEAITPFYFTDFGANSLLISTNIGVVVMDKRSGRFSMFEPLQKQFENKVVRQLLHRGDRLYLISSGKLYVHDLRTATTTEYTNFSGISGPKVANATCLYADRQNRIWVGVNQGLSLINEDNTFNNYQFEKNTSRPEGSYFMVLSIEEIEGTLWVGTFDSGIWQMELSDGHDAPIITNLKMPEPWISNTIYATLPDVEGNVWISTNQGIFKYEKSTYRFIQFTTSEGLQDNEFNRLAYCNTRSGLMVFGGVNGINIFDPREISLNSVVSKPHILSVVTNPETETENYSDLRGQQTIRLHPDQKFLVFRFVIPNYQKPSRFEAEYMLEKHDLKWHPAVTNQASYANLKPGEYTFRVRVRSGNLAEEESLLRVIIEPPFWQTVWFGGLILLTLVMAGYGIFKGYTAKAIRDRERLEQLLQLRTREIEKSRAELEDLNQKKDMIFSILSHDLRGPLTTLKGFLSLIIDNTDTLAKEDIRKHANNIRNSVASSLDLIDNTLFWSLSQTGSITFTPTRFSLNDTLRKIHRLYQLTADHKSIQLDLRVDEELKVYGDQNMLYVALRNIVSNALKFTPPGKNVSIQAFGNHESAIVKVKDDGIGMNSAYVKKLLSNDQPLLKAGTSHEKGTGLGLVLCKKFIHMNHGSLAIESVEKKGSEFTITIPLSGPNGNGSTPAPAAAPHYPAS